MEKAREIKDGKSRRTLFDPTSSVPFQLSRYRLERFLDCARCFWLDLRKDVRRPEPHPYTLNVAVDALVKREFDKYRERQKPHPFMTQCGIDGVPFKHPDLADWRLTTKGKGMRFLHPETNFDIMGAPDDIWLLNVGKKRRLAIVDAKSTSAREIKPIEDERWRTYRRQIDIYIWLLDRQNTGYPVSRTGYFLHLNGISSRPTFGWRLHFTPSIIAYDADDSWVDDAIRAAHACLKANTPPAPAENCEHCEYRRKAAKFAP